MKNPTKSVQIILDKIYNAIIVRGFEDNVKIMDKSVKAYYYTKIMKEMNVDISDFWDFVYQYELNLFQEI